MAQKESRLQITVGGERMADLNGRYYHKLDAKGRLSLPAKIRGKLSGSLVVLVEPASKCLYAFEPDDFDKWMVDIFQKDGGYNPSNSRHTSIRTVLKSRAFDVDIDAANRINLTPDQRKEVGIEKDVILVGNTGYFEIWDAKRWDSFCGEVDIASFFE